MLLKPRPVTSRHSFRDLARRKIEFEIFLRELIYPRPGIFTVSLRSRRDFQTRGRLKAAGSVRAGARATGATGTVSAGAAGAARVVGTGTARAARLALHTQAGSFECNERMRIRQRRISGCRWYGIIKIIAPEFDHVGCVAVINR